jgi:hypothetical protein
MLDLSWRKVAGQGAKYTTKLSVNKHRTGSKGWKQWRGDKPPPKAGKAVDPRTGLLGHRAVSKTKLPHLAGGGSDKTELQLKDNTAGSWWKQQLWPPCVTWHNYFTSQFQKNWWTERNTPHKPVTLWHHIRPSAYMPIPGLDDREITPELKPKTVILFFLNLMVLYCFFFCFGFSPSFSSF